MTRTMLVVVTALIALVPTARADEIAGTRPGPDGEPLKISATLFLLDVSKIDGADQSFTADIFLMLRWRDELQELYLADYPVFAMRALKAALMQEESVGFP